MSSGLIYLLLTITAFKLFNNRLLSDELSLKIGCASQIRSTTLANMVDLTRRAADAPPL